MNIICDQHLLRNAIDGVVRAVSTRSSIPVLEGILLKADGFQLTLTGYDMQIGIVTSIECNVRETGQVVLNGKLFSDMIHRLPAGDVLLTVSDQGKVFIRGGDAHFEIMSMTTYDYPDLPKTDAARTLTMPAGKLRQMIDYTLYAVSQDDQKPAHTGMLFEIEPDSLTVVALDGYRLAIVEREITATKDIKVIIPSKTMQEVNRLLPSDEEEEVHLSANRRFTVFQVNGYTIISRVIEGEFLNYRNVVPSSYRTKVTIDTREFIDTIERDSLLITERLKNPLRITFQDNKVEVRCQTNLGKVMDELECKTEGDSIEIGFNHRYLLDALRNAKQDKVVFYISGALSPVKMLPEEGNDFTYLVLPVRFKND